MTEYEARAKHLEDGQEKEAILDDLDLRFSNEISDLLRGNGDPSVWIVHNRDPKKLFMEHVKIGMVGHFELDTDQFALPDGVKDCSGIDNGCVPCTNAAKAIFQY